MNHRANVAVLLSCTLALPAGAQSPRAPSVSYQPGFRGAYKAGSVSGTDFQDSSRARDLIRAGQMYLSLQDAIALALENNLDVELQRYGIRSAETDTVRAQGGGIVRGLNLSINETPAGVGGPGNALNNSAATGVTPSTSVPTNVTDSQLIQESQNNLAVTGLIPIGTGPLIPQFDPAITGQFLAQHLSTPQTNLVVSGTPSLNNNNINGNLGYSQGFSPGTQVVAGVQSLRTDSNSTRNLINPYYNSSLGVTVTQPLLRGFGSSVNRRFIRIAKNSEKISDYIFQQQVISTVSGVIRLYTDLVSLNEDFRVKQQNVTTAQRLVEDNRNKVEQGTLAPIELTRAQAQVAAARQNMINSEGFVRQQELIFKNVLTRNASADPVVHAARIIPTDTLTIDPLPEQTPEDMVRAALEGRPELQAARLQVVNSEISIKGSRNGLLPQLDVVANVSNSGLAGGANSAFTGALPTGSLLGYGDGFGSSLEQIARRDYPNYSIGINLTLPVRNRIAQSDLARDQLLLHQTEVRTKQLENQIRVEVEDAIIALQRTRAAYDAALETRNLQEQSLSIEQERFNVGLSTNFLVIQYENQAAQARSSEVIARGAYAKARTQLERALGMTLANHSVSIDEALKGQVLRKSTPQMTAPPTGPAPQVNIPPIK